MGENLNPKVISAYTLHRGRKFQLGGFDKTPHAV